MSAKARNHLVQNLLDWIKLHPNLFTFCAIVCLLVPGVAIADNRSNWWVSLVVAGAICIFALLAAVGRVILKAAFAFAVLLFSIAYSFTLGSFVNVALFSSMWVLQLLLVFTACLAYSYLRFSARGRWLYLAFTLILHNILAYAFVVSLPPTVGLLIASAASIAAFVLMYSFNGRTRVSSLMPAGAFSDGLYEALVAGAKETGHELRVIPGRKGLGDHFLLYGDTALILYPIAMDSPFGLTGRRRFQLAYHDKPINQWLLSLLFTLSPSWKARRADVGLVLIDVNTKNGERPKLMGVTVPDRKASAAVGIVPGKRAKLGTPKSGEKLIRSAFKLMGGTTANLKPKQRDALGLVGVAPDDLEGDELGKVDSSPVEEHKAENDELTTDSSAKAD